jgi:hypothetical protein
MVSELVLREQHHFPIRIDIILVVVHRAAAVIRNRSARNAAGWTDRYMSWIRPSPLQRKMSSLHLLFQKTLEGYFGSLKMRRIRVGDIVGNDAVSQIRCVQTALKPLKGTIVQQIH